MNPVERRADIEADMRNQPPTNIARTETQPMYILVDPLSFLHLFLEGSGGEKSVIGDYSAAPAVFSATVPSDRELYFGLNFMSVGAIFQADPNPLNYGPIEGGLTNGIALEVHKADTNGTIPLVPAPIKSDFEWAMIGPVAKSPYDARPSSATPGATILRVTLASPDRGLLLRPGDSIQITVQDDFTLFTEHRFEVFGQRIDVNEVQQARGNPVYCL